MILGHGAPGAILLHDGKAELSDLRAQATSICLPSHSLAPRPLAPAQSRFHIVGRHTHPLVLVFLLCQLAAMQTPHVTVILDTCSAQVSSSASSSASADKGKGKSPTDTENG